MTRNVTEKMIEAAQAKFDEFGYSAANHKALCAALTAALSAAEPSERATMVPLSNDGKYVFIDGHGDIELDWDRKLATPTPSPADRGAVEALNEQALVESENAKFKKWWKESLHADYPEIYPLTAENAAHAAWQAAAALALPAAEVKVKVKPLGWRAVHSLARQERAGAIVGSYFIIERGGMWNVELSDGDTPEKLGLFSSAEAAKAAAQADYEARILSALATPSQEREGGQSIRDMAIADFIKRFDAGFGTLAADLLRAALKEPTP